eukprot:15460153-Alexandrium_andersonii.AAC.1
MAALGSCGGSKRASPDSRRPGASRQLRRRCSVRPTRVPTARQWRAAISTPRVLAPGYCVLLLGVEPPLEASALTLWPPHSGCSAGRRAAAATVNLVPPLGAPLAQETPGA